MSAWAEEIDVLKVKSVSREDSWSKYFQTFPIQHNQTLTLSPNFQASTMKKGFTYSTWTLTKRQNSQLRDMQMTKSWMYKKGGEFSPDQEIKNFY